MEWKMRAARFCKDFCPVCRRARKKQRGICYWFVKNVDRKVCPCCKSYESVYGRLAYEPELPEDL
jgi:hypothetical protein